MFAINSAPTNALTPAAPIAIALACAIDSTLVKTAECKLAPAFAAVIAPLVMSEAIVTPVAAR
jgi:hypothetical protein